MKKLIQTLIVALITLLSVPLYAVELETETGLYTTNEFKVRSASEMYEILEQFEKEAPNKNIIVYIHGRGRNTDEEWQAISNIENLYDAKIVMFHWPSWTSLLVRPVDKAEASVPHLVEAFSQIKEYKDRNPEVFHHKKISLLTHSMGNVVFREYVKNYYAHDLNDHTGKPLFDAYVSTGADVPLTEHKEWLSKVDFAKKKFITMNNRDLVLLLSYVLDTKNGKFFQYKLGLGFDRVPFKRKSIPKLIDPDSTYIDLSRSLKLTHRYFESKEQLMIDIFKPLVNGEDFKPQLLDAKVEKENGVYYVIDKD